MSLDRSLASCWFWLALAAGWLAADAARSEDRPNILLAISDDQSFPHASAYGDPVVRTPAFDQIARQGVLFTTAICGSPGCSPSRASLLTGRYPWQIEQAGTHASSFPSQYDVYPELLEQAGYFVGYTGKGWGPGNWKISGRGQNPAGPAFNDRKLSERPGPGISNTDYAANFAEFLEQRPADRPFCFWFGGHEPHRGFARGSGSMSGKDASEVAVPAFLPDHSVIREDLLDYYQEIEHFDAHLQQMLVLLEETGQLENTLIVVTADNGMAFPRAKANCYEFGIHVPLAISWPAQVPGNRVVQDPVSFTDLAPTFLEAAGVAVPDSMSGRSLTNILTSHKEGHLDAQREAVFSARERHSSSRYNNWTYPQRAMRTSQYLLIRNFRPDRWPAGDPQKFDDGDQLGPMHGAYHDIDACPSLSLLVDLRDDPQIARYFHWAVDKRPQWELFDVVKDPACLNNLAGSVEHEPMQTQLMTAMEDYLRATRDPRILDGGEIFESYRRYSPIRRFPKPVDQE